MIKTELCEILNIEHPIIQGGMAWIATAELAAAVSNAGGLGMIGAGNAPAEEVERQIKKAKELTDKPFGVNVMLLSPYVDEVVDVVCKHKIPVVTTGAGSPARYMKRLKSIGIKVIPVVPSVALARRMETIGADAIIAEGTEAGGHIGELTTMAIVPQIKDEVNIPVIAAGGIADGRGLLAALSLGAVGVQIGTRFICATESIAHNNYKDMVINAKDRDAVVTARVTGHPVRALRNKLVRDFAELEKKGATAEEIGNLGAGALRLAVIDGDTKQGSFMAGQISGLIKKVQPSKEIINEIIEEAKKQLIIINNFNKENK